MLRHLAARTRYAIGGYSDWRILDRRTVHRWVFVCYGNICRSAFGGAFMDGGGWEFCSYGLMARDGGPANERASAVGLERGARLSNHRARNIRHYVPDRRDLLIDVFFGLLIEPRTKFSRDTPCRYTFPRDVEYVWSRLKEADLPLTQRMWSVLEFFLLSLDPRIHAALWFPENPIVYWHGFKDFVVANAHDVLARLSRR